MTTTPTLSQLLPDHDGFQNSLVNSIALDSRELKSGGWFFALPGEHVDGRDFIEAALQAGAGGIICEMPTVHSQLQTLSHLSDQYQRPIIFLSQLAQQLGMIASRFYGHPSHHLKVIGITGTNGKTTISHLTAQVLHALGFKTGICGTVGYGVMGDSLHTQSHTTPQAFHLQEQMAFFCQQQAEYVSMEVSSHAIDQGRVNGMQFSSTALTNLTPEHLDYHHTMENYGQTKKRLLEWPELNHAVLNLDDPFCASIIDTTNAADILGYAIEGGELVDKAQILACDVQLAAHQIQAQIQTPWGSGSLCCPLIGRFNLSNILAVVTLLCAEGHDLQSVLAALQKVQPISGRMQKIYLEHAPGVVVDYAHTPDALEKALMALKECNPARLWCIFGCGGERDIEKRALMAKVAESWSEHIIVTDDNPRHEDPANIIKDIMQGFDDSSKVEVIQQRAEAIKYALSRAEPGDLILIAGKGHETYQEIGGLKFPFSDVEQVKSHFEKLGFSI